MTDSRRIRDGFETDLDDHLEGEKDVKYELGIEKQRCIVPCVHDGGVRRRKEDGVEDDDA